jgi:hypothetical protein
LRRGALPAEDCPEEQGEDPSTNDQACDGSFFWMINEETDQAQQQAKRGAGNYDQPAKG